MAKELGCSDGKSNNTAEIMECLQNLPVMSFPEKMQYFVHYPWTGPNVWMPYVDSPSVSDPVLPLDSEEALKTGKFNKVRFLKVLGHL